MIAKSTITGDERRFVQSELAEKNAVGILIGENEDVIHYLVATGQLSPEEKNPDTIREVWQFCQTDAPRDVKAFYVFQNSDVAGHFEFRSLIDSSVSFPYPAGDVAAMRAARARVEAWNETIIGELVKLGWRKHYQTHNVATVASVYRKATEK